VGLAPSIETAVTPSHGQDPVRRSAYALPLWSRQRGRTPPSPTEGAEAGRDRSGRRPSADTLTVRHVTRNIGEDRSKRKTHIPCQRVDRKSSPLAKLRTGFIEGCESTAIRAGFYPSDR
jgi:hypothetical protein